MPSLSPTMTEGTIVKWCKSHVSDSAMRDLSAMDQHICKGNAEADLHAKAGAEDDLFVAQPLTAEDLVGVGLRDRVLLHHGIAQHVAGRVLGGKSHGLEPPVAAQLSVVDALHKVAGDAVAGVLSAGLVWNIWR